MVNRDQVSRFHHLQNLEGSPRAGHQDLLSDPPLPWMGRCIFPVIAHNDHRSETVPESYTRSKIGNCYILNNAINMGSWLLG